MVVRRRFVPGGPKEINARKACRKAMMAFRRVVFALTSQMEAQARITPRTKANQRPQKKRVRKAAQLQSGISASETPNEEGYGHARESDDWSCQPLP